MSNDEQLPPNSKEALEKLDIFSFAVKNIEQTGNISINQHIGYGTDITVNAHLKVELMKPPKDPLIEKVVGGCWFAAAFAMGIVVGMLITGFQ